MKKRIILLFAVLLTASVSHATGNKMNNTATDRIVVGNGVKNVQFLGKQISIGAQEVEFKKQYPAFRLSKDKLPSNIKVYDGLKGYASALFYQGNLVCVAIAWDEGAPESNQKLEERLLNGFKKTKEKIDRDEDQPMYESFRFDFVKGALSAKNSGVASAGQCKGDTSIVCDDKTAHELKKSAPKLADFWF
jgi:hypothetical protein